MYIHYFIFRRWCLNDNSNSLYYPHIVPGIWLYLCLGVFLIFNHFYFNFCWISSMVLLTILRVLLQNDVNFLLEHHLLNFCSSVWALIEEVLVGKQSPQIGHNHGTRFVLLLSDHVQLHVSWSWLDYHDSFDMIIVCEDLFIVWSIFMHLGW